MTTHTGETRCHRFWQCPTDSGKWQHFFEHTSARHSDFSIRTLFPMLGLQRLYCCWITTIN